MLMQIFFSRSHPAPDVTLRLVCVEDFAGLAGQGGVDLEEALGDVLMSVLLLIRNCFAVCLTVALFSIIYTAISTALSSI